MSEKEHGTEEQSVEETTATAGASGSEDAAEADKAATGDTGTGQTGGPDGAGEQGAADGGDAGEQELERLTAEVAEARDQVLRAQAEVQNTRRRAEQEVERARKYALERFSGELLPIVDNLERALDAADKDDERVKPIAEGVELTLKNFFDVLGKFSIEPVDPQGEPFDPQLHQAMSNVENGDVEPNTVVAVMQKGYTLNGRLVRPAMVMVSKVPSAADKGRGEP